jgi:chromosome partitioning protein
MAVITVINRKGGCGKSTLATHIAVALQQRLPGIMLVDADGQQSSARWLQRRDSHRDRVLVLQSSSDTSRLRRPPVGVRHVVVDTAGSLRGYELAKLLLVTDVVVVPVFHSVFDLESSADCVQEMKQHSKVEKGRVKLAVVGMKALPGSHVELALGEWATRQGLPYWGSIRTSTLYEKAAGQGLTVMDQPRGPHVLPEMADWLKVTDRLDDELIQHRLEREAAKRSARLKESADSSLGDSLFGHSTFDAVQYLPSHQSMVNRVPGGHRAPPPHSLTNRVLGALPSWMFKNRTRPLI